MRHMHRHIMLVVIILSLLLVAGCRASLPGGCPPDCISENLSGKDLSGVNLSEARLMDANLLKTDLTKADLSGADLSLSLIHI